MGAVAVPQKWQKWGVQSFSDTYASTRINWSAGLFSWSWQQTPGPFPSSSLIFSLCSRIGSFCPFPTLNGHWEYTPHEHCFRENHRLLVAQLVPSLAIWVPQKRIKILVFPPNKIHLKVITFRLLLLIVLKFLSDFIIYYICVGIPLFTFNLILVSLRSCKNIDFK